MRRATAILPAGSWDKTLKIGSVCLNYNDRYRRRTTLQTDRKEEFLLDLQRPKLLSGGEGLQCNDGAVIEVIAAAEKVAEIYAHDPEEMARIAWHIGNRHTPLQVVSSRVLRIHYDPILIGMVEGLGAHVHVVDAPFCPEGGAYTAPRPHSHDEPGGHSHHG